MSGVLDRMVQRVRGELPAIEPLVPSQRTAAGASVSFAALDFEREVPGNVQESNRWPTQHLSRRAEVMETISAPSAGRAMRGAESSPAMQRSDEARGQTEFDRTAKTRNLEPWTATNSRPQHETVGRNVVSKNEPNGGATEQAAGSQDTNAHGSRTEDLNKDEPRRFVGTETTDSVPSFLQARTEIDEREQPQRSRELRAPEPVVHVQAPVAEPSEHTEIYITIGSVELHAPRTEPKTPPFRPRVTLDEFLRRKAGAES